MITAQGGITKWQRVRISSDDGMVAGKLAIAKGASYLAISSAPVIRWNVSSVTNSGDARSARVILQQPTAIAFAAW